MLYDCVHVYSASQQTSSWFYCHLHVTEVEHNNDGWGYCSNQLAPTLTKHTSFTLSLTIHLFFFFNTHTTLLKPLNVKVWFEDTNESPFVFVFLFYLPLSPSTSSCPYNKYFSTFSPNCMGSTFPGSFASYLIQAWVRMSSLSGQRMFFSLYVQPMASW